MQILLFKETVGLVILDSRFSRVELILLIHHFTLIVSQVLREKSSLILMSELTSKFRENQILSI